MFSDQSNTHKRMQGPKAFRSVNLRQQFSARITTPRFTQNCVYQISRQQPTLFEPNYVIQDRFNALEHLGRPEILRGVNQRREI
jgi:hypothetical protein